MFKNMKVLVVDDVVENIQVVIDALKPLGCQFLYAKSGEACISSVKQNNPDLILLDILMPKMDGFETCKILKSDTNINSIPIIFLSAFDTNDEIVKGFDLGAVDYITKPFEPSELIARVKTHLKLYALEKKLSEENLKKEYILAHQSKMVSMGMMLENIAHQWRQPLSVISMSASGLLLAHENKMLNDDSLKENLEKIFETGKFLSNTVIDFRDFFKTSKEKNYFKFSKAIDKALLLISSRLGENIEIKLDIEDMEYCGFENELVQVLMNLINNALDVLDKAIKNYIFISIEKIDDTIELKIKDTGNGIQIDNIEMIFDPYFTTKDEENATGIGLYMSKEIVENKLESKIEVCNMDFIYENKQYRGAEFKITLPLA